MSHNLIQLNIIHISDIHFGSEFRFSPERAASGGALPDDGYPTLSDSLFADLKKFDAKRFSESPKYAGYSNQLILAITGDITNTSDTTEFNQGKEFINAVTKWDLFGRKISTKTAFLAPGNHDVIFDKKDLGERWYPYCEFYESVTDHRVKPSDAQNLTRIRDLSDSHKLIVAEINTCVHIYKDSPHVNRGHVSQAALDAIENELEQVSQEKRDSSIKIAIMHHHPIVLPDLSEPDRGYDAVENAQYLLGILRKFGFQLILHGHKHFPHVFTYDPVCAWKTDSSVPLTIVSGGSAGSKGLPPGRAATNCYNIISLKWNTSANHGRISVETRGLICEDETGRPLLAPKWYWKRLRLIDRVIVGEQEAYESKAEVRKFSDLDDGEANKQRKQKYQHLKGNMLICESMPSLDPTQAYDVRLKIVPHPNCINRVIPDKVQWIAGEKFNVAEVSKNNDDTFSVNFSYWGPMLVAAKLFFSDGSVVQSSIYAHLPK